MNAIWGMGSNDDGSSSVSSGDVFDTVSRVVIAATTTTNSQDSPEIIIPTETDAAMHDFQRSSSSSLRGLQTFTIAEDMYYDDQYARERRHLVILLVLVVLTFVTIILFFFRELIWWKFGLNICPCLSKIHIPRAIQSPFVRFRYYVSSLFSTNNNSMYGSSQNPRSLLDQFSSEGSSTYRSNGDNTPVGALARLEERKKERRSFYTLYLKPFKRILQEKDFVIDYKAAKHKNKNKSASFYCLHLPPKECANDNKDGTPGICMPVNSSTTNSTRNDDTATVRKVEANCAICLTDYEIGETIVWSSLEDCPHVYHEECMLLWLCKGKKRCPVCRNWFVPGTSIDEQMKSFFGNHSKFDTNPNHANVSDNNHHDPLLPPSQEDPGNQQSTPTKTPNENNNSRSHPETMGLKDDQHSSPLVNNNNNNGLANDDCLLSNDLLVDESLSTTRVPPSTPPRSTTGLSSKDNKDTGNMRPPHFLTTIPA